MKSITKIQDNLRECGLPAEYPIPTYRKDLLFYIQRNQNSNTIIYDVNRDNLGYLNIEDPVYVYWKQYLTGGGEQDLNSLQFSLAYGYTFDVISHQLIRFRFMAYEKKNFFIVKKESCDEYFASCKISGENAMLNNIYVFATDLGVFPRIEYAELYGSSLENPDRFLYERLVIS